ncbi:MAG: transcription termination/antitermination protein NusG [Paludibacter sp.]|nr:transcription termination/antitermination protein NusG [Bacteroidales bacterium]MCM1068310.1 transcription termination/antitermination protein NusG [Prevotella sp.]MCM1354063.1 transcription termination/antitermination protein NusG [Bacteroides sp.]MCM1442095.1 transcription termination/antitermination protein NusG [Muribaculum sp.]MCM1482011.1 transcription termination/antitermination protein NusG [Paludibacter sp.]
MADNEYKWYVLKAISGKEAKVKEYIEAACKTTELGQYVSQVLIPTEKVVQLRGGKRVIKERTFLPGYVLVEANLVDECYPRLRNVPNVLGFLSDGKSVLPTPVRQSEVNRILGNIDEQADNTVLEIPFMVGETVKVTDGPFNGFNGEVDEIMSDKRKLKVIVTVFGRKTPLELGFNQVDKE